MNNQSNKPEKLEPKDSEQKNLKHPKKDKNAIIKPEDKIYRHEEANFVNPAGRRENEEQPVNPIKIAPKE